MKNVSFVDFETEAIEGRPKYPPVPTSVSIKRPGKKSEYFAWGHPSGNNCTKEDARRALLGVWKSGDDLSFHNGKFDLDVGNVHLDLPIPQWDRVHDTMVLAYLDDPHAKKIGLKELAERHLDWKPDERDAVRDWLVANKVVPSTNKKSWGAFISKAPGDIVGPYACGDTDRTAKVQNLLLPRIIKEKMGEAYDRERRLIPVLLENERQGVTVDLTRLEADVKKYQAALEDAAKRIFKLLGGKEFNLDAGEEVADALDKKYPGISWPLTEKGNRSTSKESLAEVLEGRPPLLLALFTYHSTLTTCVRNFMEPWLRTALISGGKIFTQWNSVAQPEGGGTRTGRLSSTPNFQNIPTLKSPNFQKAIELWKKYLEKLGLPMLPAVRAYIIASKGNVLIDRDFSQQELRVLAHFEDGAMLDAYKKDPTIDFHSYAAQIIFGEATAENRKTTKNTAFGLLYGMGLGALAARLGVDVAEAKKIRNTYLNMLPGIKDIQNDLKEMARNGRPMRTWGGRLYYCEPPKIIKGIYKSFDYKMFNYLIQGSSADVTKEAWLRYHEMKKHGRLLLTVHDQMLGEVPKKAWKEEMKILKEAMNGIAIDAPLLSDGSVGTRWTEMEECE